MSRYAHTVWVLRHRYLDVPTEVSRCSCTGVWMSYRGIEVFPQGIHKVSSRSRDCMFMQWANSGRLCILYSVLVVVTVWFDGNTII